jgi:WXG100 family type VII secretion target
VGPNDQSAGDEIAVRYSSLQEASASIKQQAGRLRGDLEDIRQAVHRVTANWEGEAQTQYNTMQDQWNKKADHVQNILVSIADKVSQASGDYQATDKRAAGNF